MRDEMSNSQGCIDGEDADSLLDALDDKASVEEIKIRQKLSRERLHNSMKPKAEPQPSVDIDNEKV